MKIALIILVILQVGCSGVSSFIIGVAGNITSDTINRQAEKSECKEEDQT